jgi:hypothetical protein
MQAFQNLYLKGPVPAFKLGFLLVLYSVGDRRLCHVSCDQVRASFQLPKNENKELHLIFILKARYVHFLALIFAIN